MNAADLKHIDSANDRGLSFHVFCDEPIYLGGQHVGQHRYHTSWRSLDLALAVAHKEENGVVYNSTGRRVDQ